MNDISKDSYKALKYIATHGRIKETVTDEVVRQLLTREFIIPEGEDYYFDITEDGKAYLFKTEWFNLKYIVTNIIVPIIVGVIASIITILLSKS